jgi:hypothetical protein
MRVDDVLWRGVWMGDEMIGVISVDAGAIGDVEGWRDRCRLGDSRWVVRGGTNSKTPTTLSSPSVPTSNNTHATPYQYSPAHTPLLET